MTTLFHNLHIPALPGSLRWISVPATNDPSAALKELTALKSSSVGVSVGLSSDGELDTLALACADYVVVLWIKKRSKAHMKLLRGILHDYGAPLCGFSMGRLAIYINVGLDADVLGVDLSTLSSKSTRNADPPAKCIEDALSISVDCFTINSLWDEGLTVGNHRSLCLRAWLSSCIAERRSLEIKMALKVDTQGLPKEHIRLLCHMYREVELLDAAKSQTIENDFNAVETDGDGNIVIHNSRFKTRVRASDKTQVVMIDEYDEEHLGRAKGVEGKRSTVRPIKTVGLRNIQKIKVVGKEESTQAEKARDEFVLLVLQGQRLLKASEFIRHLWLSDKQSPTSHMKITNARITGQLNQSQANVVEAMTASNAPTIIVHGPPGTGKTSTISAAVDIWEQMGRCVWIAAQSNVGVKNIAESLLKHRVPFKLIVSKEFHFEWHEHIYERISDFIIRSDELPPHPPDMEILLYDTRVILCTLSMLSNPTLHQLQVFHRVPVHHLVIDEASQIGIFNYMHLFATFKDLKKVCFFGDPKQLPPYGKTDAPSLQCIFDVKHLKPQAYFLNTQYRMPEPIGTFISYAVYNEKLQSQHQIKETSCLAFVDVDVGCEEAVGKSWKNSREVQVIGHLVSHYYAQKQFCVITPYDAQRNAIEQYLKNNGLPWEKVFNVDSFQGNEAQFVLISVVRTAAPGFLASRNRVNVMLTRCKTGMVVVTSKAFMHTRSIQNTLLGELCQHWEQLELDRGCQSAWRNWRAVAEETCNLPGVNGRDMQPTSPVLLSLSSLQISAPTRTQVEYEPSSVPLVGRPTVQVHSSVPMWKPPRPTFPSLPSSANDKALKGPILLGQWAQGTRAVSKHISVPAKLPYVVKKQEGKESKRKRNAKAKMPVPLSGLGFYAD